MRKSIRYKISMSAAGVNCWEIDAECQSLSACVSLVSDFKQVCAGIVVSIVIIYDWIIFKCSSQSSFILRMIALPTMNELL